MEQLTVQGQVGKDKGLGDDSTWTEADLLTEMRKKAAERFSVDKADLVQHEVTVDFEMMGATEEYQALKGLESVLLYDSVKVIDEQIGLDVSLEVTELEWDAIKEKVVAITVSNVSANSSVKNVTGYNVQNKSIGLNKLSDDVAGEIISQVVDIIPEYADPDAARPSSDITVYDGLDSTSTTDALSAKQGKVLNGKITTEYATPISITLGTATATLTPLRTGGLVSFNFSIGASTGSPFSDVTFPAEIGTLPEGYRPAYEKVIPIAARTAAVWADATYYQCAVAIAANGKISIRGNQSNLRTCRYVFGHPVFMK